MLSALLPASSASVNGGSGWTKLASAAPGAAAAAAAAAAAPPPRLAAVRAWCSRTPCVRHPHACTWVLAGLQAAALIATGCLAVATAVRAPAQPGTIVRELRVAGAGGAGGGGGCPGPLRAGAPVSLAADGSVRGGGGTSVYRGASAVYFAAPVASHALAALPPAAGGGAAAATAAGVSASASASAGSSTLLAGFAAAGDANGATLVVGTPTDGGGKAAAWTWSGFAPLAPTAPDAIIGLQLDAGAAAGGEAQAGADFAVVGGGWATRGRVLPAAHGGSPELELQAPGAYAPSPGDGGGDDDGSGAVLGRTSAALLAPGVLAVSFVLGSGTVNASLMTRIGTAVDDGIVWGVPAARPGAYLWHALARMDSSTYLLAFPAVEAAATGAAAPSSVAAGAALVVVAASVEAPAAAAAGAPDPTAARVILSEGSELASVRAHYYIDVAAVSPALAVIVFVDASINDGIRAVLVELRPDRSLIFGATLTLNSGHGGGNDGLGGAWLHLALTPLIESSAPSSSVSAAAARDTTALGSRAGDDSTGDDDGYFDDDDGHVVAARAPVTWPFALSYSNLADGGRVTAIFAQVTPAAELQITSPPWVISAPLADASPDRKRLASPAGDAPASSPAPFFTPSSWVSAVALSPTQLLVLDTAEVTGATSTAAAGALRRRRRRAAAASQRAAVVCGSGVLRACARAPEVPDALPPGLSYPPVVAANLTLIERINRPIGIALEDAACGDTVLVLMQGTFTYSGGAPQTGSSAERRRVRRRQHGSGAADAAGGALPPPNPIPGCNGAVPAPVARRYPTGPFGEFTAPAASDAGCATDGPFTPGRAYYADTRGQLVEGDFAGTGGDNQRAVSEASTYLTTLSTRFVSQGDTSTALEGYVGVATSSYDLLLKL